MMTPINVLTMFGLVVGMSMALTELCPTGWVSFENNCYLFPTKNGNVGVNWDEANKYCRSKAATLPTLKSEAEWAFLREQENKDSNHLSYWLGSWKDYDRDNEDATSWRKASGSFPFSKKFYGNTFSTAKKFFCYTKGEPHCARFNGFVWSFVDCKATSCGEGIYPVCVKPSVASQPRYHLSMDEECPLGYAPLLTGWQDCEAAAKSLKYAGDAVAHVSYKSDTPRDTEPAGCALVANGRFHYNPKPLPANVGKGDRILCKEEEQSRAQTNSYTRKMKSCVNGANIRKYTRKTVQECKRICDENDKCVAFEFGVDYGGRGGYKPGDCQPQWSTNYAGCNGAHHNLDLYIKTKASTPLPTPSPTPSPTSNPTPSPTPNPTPSPTPSPTLASTPACGHKVDMYTLSSIRIEIESFTLNGKCTDGEKREITIKRGQHLVLQADWVNRKKGCKGCIEKLYIGLKGKPLQCLKNPLRTLRGTYTKTYAFSDVGVYEIVGRAEYGRSCNSNYKKGNRVATIRVVAPPLPTPSPTPSPTPAPTPAPRWADGTRCLLGTSCEKCKNKATFWSSKKFTACGVEPKTCMSKGDTCDFRYPWAPKCTQCCNGYRYIKLGRFTGFECK